MARITTPIKIITFPSRMTHYIELDESEIVTENDIEGLEEALNSRVKGWKWLNQSIANELVTAVSLCTFPVRKKQFNVFCDISYPPVSIFGKSNNNPLDNKTFTPSSFLFDLAKWISVLNNGNGSSFSIDDDDGEEEEEPEEQGAVTASAIVHFLRVNAATLVMVGVLVIVPGVNGMKILGSNESTKVLMADHRRTVTTVFLIKSGSMSITEEKLDSHVTLSGVSPGWRELVWTATFFMLDKKHVKLERRKKRKHSEIEKKPEGAESPPSDPMVIQRENEGEEDPYKRLLEGFISELKQVSHLRKARPDNLGDWRSWLNIPELVKEQWVDSIGNAEANIYNLTLRTQPKGVTSKVIVQICIAFAIFIYPYRLWTSFKLRLLAYNLLPLSIKKICIDLDQVTTPQQLLMASNWTAVATTIFLEQILLPIIDCSLGLVVSKFDEATQVKDRSRFAIAYADAQELVSDQFASVLMDEFGTTPKPSGQVSTFQSATINETFAKTLRIHLSYQSLAHSSPFSISNKERPFLAKHLIPLSAFMVMVMLDTDDDSEELDALATRKKNARVWQVQGVDISHIYKTAPVPSANKTKLITSAFPLDDGDEGPTQKSNQSSQQRQPIILDIEDIGTDTAPRCIKDAMLIYQDNNSHFTHEARQLLLQSLLKLAAHFTGSIDARVTTEKSSFRPMTTVSDVNKRENVANFARAWLYRNNPTRFRQMEENGEDGGSDMNGFLQSFKNPAGKGGIYTHSCICAPQESQQSGGGFSNQFICPFLEDERTENEKRVKEDRLANGANRNPGIGLNEGQLRNRAFRACKKSLGQSEDKMHIAYQPATILIHRTSDRAFKRNQQRQRAQL